MSVVNGNLPSTTALFISKSGALNLFGGNQTVGDLSGAGKVTNSFPATIATLTTGGDGSSQTFSGEDSRRGRSGRPDFGRRDLDAVRYQFLQRRHVCRVGHADSGRQRGDCRRFELDRRQSHVFWRSSAGGRGALLGHRTRAGAGHPGAGSRCGRRYSAAFTADHPPRSGDYASKASNPGQHVTVVSGLCQPPGGETFRATSCGPQVFGSYWHAGVAAFSTGSTMRQACST